MKRVALVAVAVAALGLVGVPVAEASKPDRRVCNAQGVCCSLDALGNVADCLIPGSPGFPGNPGQYSDPYPTNAVPIPPRGPIDPAHSTPWGP